MLKPISRPRLDVIFVGFNPHLYSWQRGKYYAHGSLWRILRKSGLAPDIQDDSQLLRYNFGITDLVPDRPTREGKEISDADYAEAAIKFRHKLARLKPRIVCFAGKDVYRHFAAAGRKAKIEYGVVGRYKESLLYVALFSSHKWLTDKAKAQHYRQLRAMLAAENLLSASETIKVSD